MLRQKIWRFWQILCKKIKIFLIENYGIKC
jgi:hypothetical protein